VGVGFEKEMDLEFEQVIRVLSTYILVIYI
jgi:hypothetical protein